MLHKEINKETGSLFGDEMLEVEEQIVSDKECRACGKRLNYTF